MLLLGLSILCEKKEMKGLYAEHCKTLTKDVEDNTKKWKDAHVHEFRVLLKCPYYPKQYTGLMQSKYLWHPSQN